jgi:glucosamine--fructose-6-phosphate aminotransferase (isomerizing)
MCGIIGYIGCRDIVPVLIDGLKSLEYRGYDSAGIAVLEKGKLKVLRNKGKINSLEEKVKNRFKEAVVGIGHTRWATHGRPSRGNAHPHRDCHGHIAVVHNGIIENYQQLRQRLKEKGHIFSSETDTEIIPHLIEEYYHGNLLEAVNSAINELEGSYAIAVISALSPHMIVAARKNSPLVIGIGKDEYFYASDIPAVVKYTSDIIILEDGETAMLTPNGAAVYRNMEPVAKNISHINWNCKAITKDGYEHFMLKEIHEQPGALRGIIERHILPAGPILTELKLTPTQLSAIKRVQIVGCGTAYHAGLIGKHIIEGLLRMPVEVDIASELRYANPIYTADTLIIGISQSGETADTLAALSDSRGKAGHILAISNVRDSSISRLADSIIYTEAGPEIAVASTKAYVSQIAAIYILTFYLGMSSGILNREQMELLLAEIKTLPGKIAAVIEESTEKMKQAAAYLKTRHNCFFIGRSMDYALSMEGALKLKEISYIHAEAYAAGELKHGTLALLTRDTPIIALCTQRKLTGKSVSNIKEIKARDSYVIALAFEDMKDELEGVVDRCIYLPAVSDIFAPLLAAPPLQLLAYYTAVSRGCDVDQPRNLAKSVTVE